ncbi:MAG: TetR/AcrR family transcriptional regulator [Lentibacter sp.]|jgi:AcrR family transcriptional regulator|uniref:TetR/AcrR family transcriptional regulator n=1 Tax=Lentibacter sp. TaxID=2024994 RepID=UPI00260561AF|nr:TetR/AcrR family transcriptional regulator [Lentibacter sp.]MDG1289188.1 TetR/AcrR family transcriptional regulator [Lentibacter sp.]
MARTQAKDHSAKREAILEAAARVFASEGFDRASMAALAQDAGISKANIYHYYDSKDALLFDLLDSHLKELRDRLAEVNLDGLAPAEKLLALCVEVLLAYQGADNAHRVQSAGMDHLPPDQRQILVGYQRDMVKKLSSVIAENAPDVFERDPAKLRSVTMSVFGMLNWHYMWNASADEHARRAYGAEVAKLAIGGLKAL